MTQYYENVSSVSISEGIKGVRILLVKDGKEIEFLTDGNKFDKA